jgi:hypothetical protein
VLALWGNLSEFLTVNLSLRKHLCRRKVHFLAGFYNQELVETKILLRALASLASGVVKTKSLMCLNSSTLRKQVILFCHR